jgi:hypothetical protein
MTAAMTPNPACLVTGAGGGGGVGSFSRLVVDQRLPATPAGRHAPPIALTA